MAKHRLVSMELAPKDEKNVGTLLAEEKKRPRFPFGLMLHLNNESLEKLGIMELPDVGKVMSILGIVEVTEISQRETLVGEDDRSATLQITHMVLAPEKAPQDAAKRIYPEG